MKEIKDGIVFSNDIVRILNGYNALDFNYNEAGLIIPKKDFIKELRKDFLNTTKFIFDKVTIIDEEELLDIASKLQDQYSKLFPIVSLDKIYFNSNIFLDCTRMDGSNRLVSRSYPKDSFNVENQVKRISQYLKLKNQNEIILADDVVYSGSVLGLIIKLFEKNNITVVGIISLIISQQSYRLFNDLLLGINSGYIMDDSVIDQICERDFYIGIACSGIFVKRNNETYKAPYIKPFGNPIQRASIPECYEICFSKSCIKRSINLWEEIEYLSNRKVYTEELPEKINNLDNGDIVKVLRKEMKRI